MPTNILARHTAPQQGDDELVSSCQRSWPTNRNPEPIDAAMEVLRWTYNRWNNHNKENKYEMLLSITEWPSSTGFKYNAHGGIPNMMAFDLV